MYLVRFIDIRGDQKTWRFTYRESVIGNVEYNIKYHGISQVEVAHIAEPKGFIERLYAKNGLGKYKNLPWIKYEVFKR